MKFFLVCRILEQYGSIQPQVPSLIREHGTTTLPFLLRPLFLWTPAFHPPGHFVHTSLLPGTHTR